MKFEDNTRGRSPAMPGCRLSACGRLAIQSGSGLRSGTYSKLPASRPSAATVRMHSDADAPKARIRRNGIVWEL